MADEPKQKIQIKAAAYVPHPVADGIKREFNKLGFGIIDAQFAPDDYELPAKLQAIVDKLTPKSTQPSVQRQVPAPATRTPKTPATAPAPAAPPAKPDGNDLGDMLYGSSTLQSVYVIGGKEVQLGTIVTEAFTRSGKTAQEWNELPEADRDVLLTTQLEAMQQAAIDAEKNPPAKPVSEMTDQELRDAITAAGGAKPAWNAKRENLEAAYAAATIPK